MDRLTAWERRTGGGLLCIGIVFLLGWAVPVVFPDLPAPLPTVFWALQVIAWALFTADYLIRLALAPRKLPFIVRNIPTLLVVVLPLLRALWLLRAVLLLQVVSERVRLPIRARTVVYVGGTALFLSLVGSVAVLEVERPSPDANIQNIGDALWWSLTTMTTVGYGDRFPTTAEGRLVATGLMIAGIALLGVVTAAIASWFVERFERNAALERKTEAELSLVVGELAELRKLLTGLSETPAELTELRRQVAALSAKLGDPMDGPMDDPASEPMNDRAARS
ncbi:two pore domain potassium channel family protein [Nonomuraea sp. NN258]|uniref:potassium channel family protein n=1 Tax=Nonomuraea antri TaxID=2730852 RepID=UPI001568BA57|nr:potassium channel family protein [Nonomuraea antri]NRQ40761.1 two pore domain potassium channel family protein [Nonomuraea antri]